MMSFFMRVVLILLFPGLLYANGEIHNHQINGNFDEHNDNGHQINGNIDEHNGNDNGEDEEEHNNDIRELDYSDVTFLNSVYSWFESEIDQDVKLWLGIENNEFGGHSEINQYVRVFTTKRYGKALTIDGILQTTEFDEFIFHESLVHPALLIHEEPKSVFIMGGGSGSAAREVLKHKNIENVIICEIDRLVYDLCVEHMQVNLEAFNDERLVTIINDAKEQLISSDEKFDVIVGDVCEPQGFSTHSNNLYTKSFYEDVVKPKLKDNGIFVTQAGPAGISTHKIVFSPIHNTIKQVFTHVVAYTAMIPSRGDSCGFIMASNEPININAELVDDTIGQRITGELKYLDGPVFAATTVFNRTLRNSLMEETRVLTEENVGLVLGRRLRTRNIYIF